MKFEDRLLLDHDPGHPCIRHGEQEEQANDRTGAKIKKLDAECKGKEDTGRENVDGPFKTHVIKIGLLLMYLTCFISIFSRSCCNGWLTDGWNESPLMV